MVIKMNEHSNIPKIRFKGFTDVWEQRKLGDVSFFKQGSQVDLDKQYSDLNENRVRFIRIVDYTQNTDDIRYIDKELSNNVINEKDVVIVRYGATAGFVGHGITGVLANNMFTVNPENDIVKDYLYIYLKQDKIYKKLNNSNGSSAMPALNFGTVKDVEIAYPLVAEQDKIGELFTNLDNLITLHQRKCDNLINVKKSLLEKMFPKNSSNIPELRFKGFNDVWEQRKFDTLAKVDRGLTYSPNNLANNGIRVLRSSNINDDQFKLYDEDVFVTPNSINIEYANNNDILITSANGSSRLVGKHTIIKGISSGSTVHGGFMLLARPYINSYFLNASMSSSWYKKFIDLYVAGGNGAIGNLSKTDLDNQIVNIPNESEINKIGDLFKNIDNLITLHQRKLEKLNNIKKSLLDKMFV